MTNRYVAEQGCLRVGAQHIACAGNPPNVASVPLTYPCLRTVIQQLGYVPTSTHLTTCLIRQTLTERLPEPKVVLETPSVNWRRIWRNIFGSSNLTSLQRSTLYLLANAKIGHGALLWRMNRVQTSSCSFCPSIDTLEHKFACCSRVAGAWQLLQQCISLVIPGCSTASRFSFDLLRLPELSGICADKRSKILCLFANYVIHIIGNNDAAIDIDVLRHSLY